MAERLAAEILDASNGVGASVKKREDVFKIMTDPFVGKLTYVRVYSGRAADVYKRQPQGQAGPLPPEPARQARRLLRPFGHRYQMCIRDSI